MAKVQTKNKVTFSNTDFKALVANYIGEEAVDTEEKKKAVLEYAKQHYQSLYDDYANGHVLLDEDMTPHDYALNSIANGISDGAHMDDVTTVDLNNGYAIQKKDEQEIVEVDQKAVKEALKALMLNGANSRMKAMLELLYEKHKEYNEQYFFGALSHPLITIDKMSNRTLGCYYHGENGDMLGIKNHISMNINFIALNSEERILETLRHEMIHQWQDEVIYKGRNNTNKNRTFTAWVEDGEGFTQEEQEQKNRPVEWHNKDFKLMAKVVGIPAKGSTCHGNPANMPEAKSYNRKFICGCISSNGHPLTVWSTRQINATCNLCKQKYIEMPKGGKLIKVKQSHIEVGKEDKVKQEMLKKYDNFKRFRSKKERDDYEKALKGHVVEVGIYQKGHNAYHEGFTHWIAYGLKPEALEVEEPKPATPAKPKAPKAKKKAKPEEPKKKVEPTEEPAPAVEPKQEEPKAVEVEKSASEEPKPTEQKRKPGRPKSTPVKVDLGNKVYSYKNKEDLVELYKKLGTVKAIADHFMKKSGTILYQMKRLHIDPKLLKGEGGEE